MSPRLSDLFLSAQSDDRLVTLARAGHQRAFAAIVERYGSELEALARRLTSDGRSEDVVQQAFLSAFAALNTGAEVRHLRGWLYQIVRNAATRPQGPACVPLDGATPSADTLEDMVQQRALAMAALTELGRLPTRQRQAMIGTALDGRPRAEIASSMGLSEGAVRQLVHRARTTLRSAVTALTPWPLARWVASLRPGGPGTAELTAGAGAASSGGLALKLGALVASGTVLTGAAVELHAVPTHRAGSGAAARAAAPHHGRPGVSAAPALAVAAVISQPRATGAIADPVPRRRMTTTGHAVPGRVTASNAQRGATRHGSTRVGSGGRSDARRLESAAGNRGRSLQASSTQRDGRGGNVQSPARSGSDGHQHAGGTRSDAGSQSDGGTSTGSASRGDGGSSGQDSRQGSGAQATAASAQGYDGGTLTGSYYDGSGSDSTSSSGSASGTSWGSQSGSGSDSASGSGSDSTSGSGLNSTSGSGSVSTSGSGSGTATTSGSGSGTAPDGGTSNS